MTWAGRQFWAVAMVTGAPEASSAKVASHDREIGGVSEKRLVAGGRGGEVRRRSRGEDRYLAWCGRARLGEEARRLGVGVARARRAAVDGDIKPEFLEEGAGVGVDDIDARVAVRGARREHTTALGVAQKVQQGQPVVHVAAANSHGVVEIEDDVLHR